jgi:hypothetical protein
LAVKSSHRKLCTGCSKRADLHVHLGLRDHRAEHLEARHEVPLGGVGIDTFDGEAQQPVLGCLAGGDRERDRVHPADGEHAPRRGLSRPKPHRCPLHPVVGDSISSAACNSANRSTTCVDSAGLLRRWRARSDKLGRCVVALVEYQHQGPASRDSLPSPRRCPSTGRARPCARSG